MTFGDWNDLTGPGHGQPASKGFAITPSDTENLRYITRAIYVGGSGNIAFRTDAGDILAFAGAVVGTVLPIRANKVYSTGTTATNLVGLL